MIPQSQFDRIQMTSATRRIAKAEMAAAEAMIDFWTGVGAKARTAVGMRERAPGRFARRAHGRVVGAQ